MTPASSASLVWAFYSSFIVAEEVTLRTRKAGEAADQGVEWISKGKGDYSIASIDKPTRGTEITLQLREGEDEYLNDWKLRSIITEYSDHIGFPVLMDKKVEAESGRGRDRHRGRNCEPGFGPVDA